MNIEVLKEYISKDRFGLFKELLNKTIEVNNDYKEEHSYLYEYIFLNSNQPEYYIIECLQCKIPIYDVSSFLLDCSVYRLPRCIQVGLESGCIDMSNSNHYEYFQSFLLHRDRVVNMNRLQPSLCGYSRLVSKVAHF